LIMVLLYHNLSIISSVFLMFFPKNLKN